MPHADLLELMKLYARRGVAEWQTAPGERRTRAQRCLGMGIADDDGQAAVAINAIYRGKVDARFRYIPMPSFPKKTGIEQSFFIPIHTLDGTTAFDLFLIVTGNKCMGYRFEPAHPMRSLHGYGHVQMSRMLLKKTVPLKFVPTWLPDKYPAFALSTSNPLRMFLSMVTAMHGYQGGVTRVLQEIFQEVGRPREVAKYLGELKALLN